MFLRGKNKLNAFCERHPDAKKQIEAWISKIKRSSWKRPQDLQADYGNAKTIPNRAVFKIKGNTYRLVAHIKYAKENHQGLVTVRFVDTHAEYDKIDANTV